MRARRQASDTHGETSGAATAASSGSGQTPTDHSDGADKPIRPDGFEAQDKIERRVTWSDGDWEQVDPGHRPRTPFDDRRRDPDYVPPAKRRSVQLCHDDTRDILQRVAHIVQRAMRPCVGDDVGAHQVMVSRKCVTERTRRKAHKRRYLGDRSQKPTDLYTNRQKHDSGPNTLSTKPYEF